MFERPTIWRESPRSPPYMSIGTNSRCPPHVPQSRVEQSWIVRFSLSEICGPRLICLDRSCSRTSLTDVSPAAAGWHIGLGRRRIEPFIDRQIELVGTFADQAVTAIENARLLTEQREALERQTAVAEVLQVINASPGNLAPVFDAMLEKAMRLCRAAMGGIYGYDGTWFSPIALRGVTPAFVAFSAEHAVPSGPRAVPTCILETKRPVQIPDLADSSIYTRGMVDLAGIRALLDVPLLKDESCLGSLRFIARSLALFPTNKSPCWRTSLPRR